ncbi:dual specificity protein phosphatase 7-like [Babylonia areolata]|uniref:dual specificity protein phosphatase 7-like n=1 Tax=Babylonia areolata TaxID=304850 RepID=UPI003FD1B96A
MPSRELFNINTMSCDAHDCFSPERLREEIRNHGKVLVVDCRTQAEFVRAHVRQAINISLPSLMQKRLKRGSLNVSSVIHNNEAKERFSRCCKTHVVLLYDDCSSDLNANPSSVLSLLVKKLRQDGSKVAFLIGGFSTFQQRFPEYCQSQESTDNSILGLCNLRISEDPASYPADGSGADPVENNTPHMSPFPVKVLPYLYLGNAKNSADLTQLRKNGIHYILNVTPNVPNMFEDNGDFKYLQIPISDHWSQNLSSFFPDAIAFIDEARKRKQGVLVHCLAGISRSVTVTVAYLMSRQSMCLNEAYDFVKKCKPNISPNFTFMGQLLDFEKALHHQTSCSCSSTKPSSSSTSSADDDSLPASDCDSDKASPPFEVSPV